MSDMDKPKCEHKTSVELFSTDNITVAACHWGCGAILIIVEDDHGISHQFTADEVLGMADEIEELQETLRALDKDLEQAEAKIWQKGIES